MKTAIKLTAIAAVTVLLALSCAPPEPLSLTAPDWAARDEAKNADINNGGYTGDTDRLTTFDIDVVADLKYDIGTTPPGATDPKTKLTDTDKSIKFIFPPDADVLRGNNDGIKDFLKFYTYKNPDPPAPPAVAPIHTPSDLSATELAYTVVGAGTQAKTDGGRGITVVLNDDTNQYTIVYKIDATKYKRAGRLIDLNGNGKPGEANYDDWYDEIEITNTAPTVPAAGSPSNGDFVHPVFSSSSVYLTLFDGFSGGSFDTTGDATHIKNIPVATFNASNAECKEFFDAMTGSSAGYFSLEKYDNGAGTWTTVPATAATFKVYKYDDATSTGTPSDLGPAFNNEDLIYVSFKPDNLGIYRVKATKMKDLTTTKNIGSKSPAKFKVKAGSEDPTFFKETFYSEPKAFYDTNSTKYDWQDPLTDKPFGNNAVVTRDQNGKNVKIELDVEPITVAGTDTYPDVTKMTTDEFNKNVKLVYNKNGGSVNLNDDDLLDYLVELKVDSILFDKDTRADKDAKNYTKLFITLDPGYQISGGRDIYVLINTGYKYTDAKITFGDPDSLVLYKGLFFWGNYGTLVSGL